MRGKFPPGPLYMADVFHDGLNLHASPDRTAAASIVKTNVARRGLFLGDPTSADQDLHNLAVSPARTDLGIEVLFMMILISSVGPLTSLPAIASLESAIAAKRKC